MQLNTFRTILAAVSVAAFASACTHSKSSPEATASALGGVKLSPAQIALQKEMVKFEPGFDVTKTFLAGKIGGITIDSLSTVTASAHEDQGTYQLSGSLVTRGGNVYKFASDEIFTDELRAGKIFDVTVDDSEKKLEADLGGLLSIKARCMDSGCKSVSMWLMSYNLHGLASAGVIFTEDSKNAYAVSNSQQDLIMTVAQYNERLTRSNREDDPINNPAHDTAPAPAAAAAAVSAPPVQLVGP